MPKFPSYNIFYCYTHRSKYKQTNTCSQCHYLFAAHNDNFNFFKYNKPYLFYSYMTVELTAEQQIKFSKLMFQSEGKQKQEVSKLTPQQKQKLKTLYAQKIAYEIANPNIDQKGADKKQDSASADGVISKICCCFLPQQNKQNFDITSAAFIKKIFSTFLFFKSDFLQINEAKKQLYGFMWLSISYVVILGLAANLNEYFILPFNYKFSNELLVQALGLSAIFLISEPFIYAGVVKCLGGSIEYIESMMLCGYSIVLYFIPTILCLIPSMYWHLGMLTIGGILRAIFLFRNYGPKLTEKTYVFLGVAVGIQVLFVLAIMRTLFKNDNGYNFSDGTSKVFSHYTLRTFVQ